MTTFDKIIPILEEVFAGHRSALDGFEWLVCNRDLNGRLRLIAPEPTRNDPTQGGNLDMLTAALAEKLGAHAYPVNSRLLYDDSAEDALQGASAFRLNGYNNIWIADRLATEGDWAHIADEACGAPRIVFFSIKGGVGRSSALAATAWHLAQSGKRVLVLDMDLESPGLSSSLLSSSRQPLYGITDWLVEDLVENAEAVTDSMYAMSDLSHEGEIYIVPAHGKDPGEYVAKLARAWMPKVTPDSIRHKWPDRLNRMIAALELRLSPDLILIDSRSGIDEVASACITELGANLILLFAVAGSQTWVGYRILFDHWRRHGVVGSIRENLQIVGALLPETDREKYTQGLIDDAYDLFADTLYDTIPAGEIIGDNFHYDPSNESAPHYPWLIKWHRSFAGLRSLYGRFDGVDVDEVNSIFGPLISKVTATVEKDHVHD